ncbi:hypothetical protein [Vibrio sp. 1180_3]|uniref:hypothetical protein n=1 Tax=Vibrio sp. 1180_3 TaxID=2528832 RepID=UPI002405AFE9|nr:hypothetical protein [Vibrio sp. 1180_3]MDF9399084.1 hypothetical protein [Vibrio sp. 1180_3]
MREALTDVEKQYYFKIYLSGELASKSRESRKANPYDALSHESAVWCAGFDDNETLERRYPV